MMMRVCALALWFALWCALVAGAAAYTVDCNHEYTDCDTELSKLANEEDDVPVSPIPATKAPKQTTPPTTTTTVVIGIEETTKSQDTRDIDTTETKQPRLLNLNVEDLQSFANALHNETKDNKKISDLSDVNLDDEEDDPPKMIGPGHDHSKHDKQISDKFYTNLQVPFHPMMTNIDRASEETETCRENEVMYKIGDRIERGCEESCECTPGGIFDCSPRCKHPYIRRGRRLNDPLCFESPVDECCSIIACATGNQELKVSKVEVCKYGNDTHPVGSKWNIGCEQTCTCELDSIVTCKPRCRKLEQSDKCINVQDPNDECCEVQICDVSQDVHEEQENATSTTTARPNVTSTTEGLKGFEDYDTAKTFRPLVLAEPIGSVKVLQNNSVQVNLMHWNTSDDPVHLLLSKDGGKSFEDVELLYSNLILNLDGGKDYILKTKETGTKFNFTITATNDGETSKNINTSNRVGCSHDGHFYNVGEEFHIGCSELCECTGPDQHECVELVCPSHVGLELVSKGCVRWAPSPPPTPPNCCPRTARCISDGTCHYKGIAIPNWSEVPLSLSGCEQRCFCENGELDCQEVCTPLPPVPPQSLRCPPQHRPAPLNISDEDCCKQWGCIPNHAEDRNGTTLQTHNMSKLHLNYVTPVASVFPSTASPYSPILPNREFTDFFRHLHPVKTVSKLIKNDEPSKYSVKVGKLITDMNNVTVFQLNDKSHPIQTIPSLPVPPMKAQTQKANNLGNVIDKTKFAYHHDIKQPPVYPMSDDAMHELIQPSTIRKEMYNTPTKHTGNLYFPPKKSDTSKTEMVNFFVPVDDKYSSKMVDRQPYELQKQNTPMPVPSKAMRPMFVPNINPFILKTPHYSLKKVADSTNKAHLTRKEQVFKLRSKDVHNMRPDDVWNQENKAHVLMKAPNPYENVLMRPVQTQLVAAYRKDTGQREMNSPIDFDRLVNQMDVEAELNRNLERSADKTQEKKAGQPIPPGAASPPRTTPSFLPTIPPEIHFPPDELPDYDQNNLHRPVNSLEPNPGVPPGVPIPPNYPEENKKLSVISLQADSPTSIKLLFGLPPVLVGLRGSVDLRYTDKLDSDISHWYSQVFAPADEVLTTPRLEFRLTGLKPSTTYKIRGKLYLHNLPVEPQSEIYSVRTLDLPTVPTPAEEKRREIDSRLMVADVNDTVAHVTWRHFTEDELQYIDGIQVRYRPVGTPIYSMTELLHHSKSAAELRELRPGTRYEASLVLVPPPRSTTELRDPATVQFNTAPYVDPYNWSVVIEAHVVGSEAAELMWHGVPSPAERWVRVYRAAHACGASRQEHDAFRLATRDIPPTILLKGLEPNTKCRVWMELFLTNGKIKTSNVLEVSTKTEDSPEEIDNTIEASSIADSRGEGRGDYYGALVVVGVVAALGALTSLLLLLVIVRRHRPRSVPITPVPTAPRESSLPPYDNPAYKLELQQETMDL